MLSGIGKDWVLHKPTRYKKMCKKGIRVNKSSGDGAENYAGP